jgi:hypothetical protein
VFAGPVHARASERVKSFEKSKLQGISVLTSNRHSLNKLGREFTKTNGRRQKDPGMLEGEYPKYAR